MPRLVTEETCWPLGASALVREAEVADKLGDNAPDMDASNLHPWAWENGKSYWNNGFHHQAVMQAALRINAEAQAKLARVDVSETDLFNQAFSLDPPKTGMARFRLIKDDGSKTYHSLHRGARSFAEGLYAAIRNPGMHVPHDGGAEQLALEQLAAFSLLARWIDQADVESV
ncbi:TIGR02391 family protein [Phycicoccus jejuensis]|uniref:TIGR02391 family protein n=1 Tax=Phycicoccus jejuensis TaxID=367299 RepID=UPI0009FED265|nr:TIGR02391 family protein [Phycicoccus jejuensis]